MWVEVFCLCYSTRHMSKFGSWQKLRGIANSKSIEPALFVYKCKPPKCIPKNRMYVDTGSSLFNEVIKHVFVLAPHQQAFVPREVRATSLLTMVGVPHDEDQSEQQTLMLFCPRRTTMVRGCISKLRPIQRTHHARPPT